MLVKRIILFVLIGFISFDAFSQVLSKTRIYWSDHPISWAIISDKPPKGIQKPYNIDIRVDFGYIKEERNDTIFYLNDFKIFYNPDLTWCIPEYREDSILKVFQLLFDFSEYKRREIQRIGNRKRMVPFIRNYMIYELDTIFQKVYEAKNSDILELYIDYYRTQINNEEIEYYPGYSINDIGFGLDFGLNGSILNGSVNNYLKNNLGANFNFYYYFNRNFLSFGMLFGFSGLKQEIPDTDYYPSDKTHANITIQPLLYGREFKLYNGYLLYPIVGISLFGVGSKVEGEKQSLSIWSKPSPCVGFKLNLPYKKRVVFSSSQSKFFAKEFVQNDFAIRLLVNKVNLSNDISGIMTSIGVSYNIAAKSMNF